MATRRPPGESGAGGRLEGRVGEHRNWSATAVVGQNDAMRKLKLQVQATLDGFVAGPNGEMDFMVWN